MRGEWARGRIHPEQVVSLSQVFFKYAVNVTFKVTAKIDLTESVF